MYIPRSTYRLQFTPSFTFNDARQMLPYLAELGVSTVYASPVFKAKSGSTHGYDIIDMRQINPELGSPEDFSALLESASELHLGWLQDIVPNHMAFDYANHLMVELLENGPGILPLHYFDVEWNHQYESLKGRLLAPFLGDIYGNCLERGEIRLGYDQNGFNLTYYSHRFPLKIETYTMILGHNAEHLEADLGASHPGVIRALGVLSAIGNLPAAHLSEERRRQVSLVKSIIWELYTTDNSIRALIDRTITEFNGTPGNPASFALLDSLHSAQLFKLSYWKVANEELNYRRFFTVNDLISVRVEDESVFEATHELVFDLAGRGKLTGIRVDHIDGLYDPGTYLERVRRKAPDAYIIVEKILGRDEQLPSSWPVQGSTGYDFLNMVTGLFCESRNERAFDRIYGAFTRLRSPFESVLTERKRLIIGKHMAGDIDNLALLIKKVSAKDRRGTDITMYGLRSALVELLAAFPVYRSYVNGERVRSDDRKNVELAIGRARSGNPGLSRELDFIERFLRLQFAEYTPDEERRDWINVVMRFQQFTGPLMAKGFEDTTLYVYNRLVALNEVGGAPSRFGVSPESFHQFNLQRAAHWTDTLNASATHDTKRGEDMRARIVAISEFASEWESHLRRWSRLNRKWRHKNHGMAIPDPNDEYLFYQTILGSWPFRDSEYAEFVKRVQEYMLKAVREAKVHTEWIQPDSAYEEGIVRFVERVLDRTANREFHDEFRPFQQLIATVGLCNSLAQTVVKATCPGVPDFYQGSELWDLSLVDPDNRRPVDFGARRRALRELDVPREQFPALIGHLLADPANGLIKLFLTKRLLQARERLADLFHDGTYVPLGASGEESGHLLAFARSKHQRMAVSVVPRLAGKYIVQHGLPLGRKAWGDTSVPLPDPAPQSWTDALTGRQVQTDVHIELAQVLVDLPVALLVSDE